MAIEHSSGLTGFGSEEQAMQAYQAAGTSRALNLGNRGPVRFEPDGSLHTSIKAAYEKIGFYVFTGVLNREELADIETDVLDMIDHAPVARNSDVDRHGRPALSANCKAKNLVWVKPLSDASGGSDDAGGRYTVKMFEPDVPAGAPKRVLQLILGSLQFSDACLRAHCHPQMLRVAEQLNGADFTPFNESVWLKHPHLGGSVSWHQDGTTQWDRPDFDGGTHGYNCMAQLYGSTAANGVWVLPGTHTSRCDIAALYAEAGSDRLPDAVPIVCDAGDIAICNRQAVHGSFANTSKDMRVTINFGFHRRASVLNSVGNGIHSPKSVYDAERIHERSRLIAYGIDARKKRFPDEVPYVYQPFAGREDEFRYDANAKAGLVDYNLLDLGI